MGIFTRKKKTAEPVSEFRMLNEIKNSLVPFGNNITKSDVVMICIDRVASQCAKLKGRYIKKDDQGIQTEKNGELAFILKYKPNPLMTPYQFIYKTITLLLLNDNAFIYPIYDRNTMKLTGIYSLNPILVEPIEDISHSYYLKFYFEDGANYISPYENMIHLKRFYGISFDLCK